MDSVGSCEKFFGGTSPFFNIMYAFDSSLLKTFFTLCQLGKAAKSAILEAHADLRTEGKVVMGDKSIGQSSLSWQLHDFTSLVHELMIFQEADTKFLAIFRNLVNGNAFGR